MMIVNERPVVVGLEMSALNSGTESALRSVDNAIGASSHGPLHRALPNASLQNASDRRPPQVIHAVIVVFDDAYLKTFPGIVRAVQLVCSLICLVFLTSSGGRQSDYLQLPVAGLLRLLVFSCVAGFLLTGLMIAIRVTQTINMFPINWNMFDLIFYSTLSLLFLISSSLAGHAVVVCQMLPQWTIQQLTGSVVFGFMCMLAYAVTAGLALRQEFYTIHQHIHKFRLSQQSSNSTFVEQLDP